MSETEVSQRPTQVVEAQSPAAQTKDSARGLGAAIKRHPVRTGIFGTALTLAAGLFGGHGSPSADRQTPTPASASPSSEAQQNTLSTADVADTKIAKPATPSPARELQFCRCGLPAGHGGDHASSSPAHEPDK